MKKLLLALALLLIPAAASAQCNGVFPNNTVCGNVTGASNTPRATNPSAFLGAAGGTNGQIQYNNGGALGGFTMSGACTTNTTTGVITCAQASFTTRAAAIAATIYSGINTIFIEGYTAANDGGGGQYNRLAIAPSPAKRWHFQSADGAWWQLAANPVVPRQLGAAIDGTTDDTLPVQAWVDYGVAFGVVSQGQPGTSVVPQTPIAMGAGTVINGLGIYTLKKTTDVNFSLLDCDTVNNVTVRNMLFTTTAGTGSVTSNDMTIGVKTFTIGTGLVGITPAVTNFQITAVSDPLQYMNGTVTAYNSGTGVVTVNVYATAGAGTFVNWYFDVYPDNGAIAPVNMALRSKTCNQVRFEDNTVTGRFYDGIDSRDGSDIFFVNNTVTGVVNRGLHQATYNVTVSNQQMLNNKVEGNVYTQYCINLSATDIGNMSKVLISGNVVNNCNFQGIEAGGSIVQSSYTENSVTLPANTVATGIVLQSLVGHAMQFASVVNNSVSGSYVGIDIIDITYFNVTSNRVLSSNICYLVVGTNTGSGVAGFGAVAGNTATTCTTNGFQFSANAAAAAINIAVNGNVAIGSTITGISSDANTNSFTFTGNVAAANGTQCSLLGTGHVTTGNKGVGC